MSTIKQYSLREVNKILKSYGFIHIRNAKNTHAIYSNGSKTISIPMSRNDVNKMLFLRIAKENNISI